MSLASTIFASTMSPGLVFDFFPGVVFKDYHDARYGDHVQKKRELRNGFPEDNSEVF
jgi:hypothetical protein